MELREEPGKQKPGSCRAQELSRSRAQGKEQQKRTSTGRQSTRSVHATEDDGEGGKVRGMRLVFLGP